MSFADELLAAGIKQAERAEVTQFLSTGYPPLDYALSNSYREGGLPLGRIVEIFGPPSAGKTAISTNVMIAAQKAGGIGMFMDHENSFDQGLAVSFGLDATFPGFIYQKPDSFEASIDKVSKVLLGARALEFKDGEIQPIKGKAPPYSFEKPIVVVFDSLASMVPQSALKEAATRNMNDNTALARATSAHFPALAKIAERTNALIIFLNQVRTKLGVMYGDPTTTPGGSAPEYYASVRLKLGRSMITKGEGANAVKLGQKIGCEAIKNKVSRPFQKAGWDFLFMEDGTGMFDVIGGVIDELVSLGKIERAGAWTTWDGKKWNSRNQLRHHIVENGQYEQLLDLFPA